MDIIKIISLSFITLFLYMYFKEQKPSVATQISLVSGVVILIFLLNPIGDIINFLKDMSVKAEIDSFYITLVLKIVGITYIATFATEICKEAGAGGIASRIELGAKILILVIAMPILMGVLEAILRIM